VSGALYFCLMAVCFVAPNLSPLARGWFAAASLFVAVLSALVKP
jgi:hypothetical protein